MSLGQTKKYNNMEEQELMVQQYEEYVENQEREKEEEKSETGSALPPADIVAFNELR